MTRVALFIATTVIVAFPARAEENGWSLEAGVGMGSALIYPLQGETLSDEFVRIGDLTACRGDVCVNVWHAEGDSPDVREDDLAISWTTAIGRAELTQSFELWNFPGLQERYYLGRLALSLPTSEQCGLEGHVDVLRGDAETESLRGIFNCDFPLSERFALYGGVGATLDRTFGAHGHYEAGASFRISERWSIEPFIEGYNGGDDRRDTAYGLMVWFGTND